MKPLPDKKDLDIMWSVATSGALETGTRPHHGFADLLYDYLTDRTLNKYGVKLGTLEKPSQGYSRKDLDAL